MQSGEALLRRLGIVFLLMSLLVPFSTASLSAEEANDPLATPESELETQHTGGTSKGPALVLDADSDEVPDDTDNCVDVANSDQTDSDGDRIGDVCDPTPDGDQADPSTARNEPDANPGEGSNNGTDDDDSGPTGDRDGDYIRDDADNCPDVPNTDQLDLNFDGVGDACSEAGSDGFDDYIFDLIGDRDHDYIPDNIDNCPDVPNTDQLDLNFDGVGDACTEPDDEDDIDVSITKTAVIDMIDAGQELVFTITVTNTGSDAATDVAFQDILPSTGQAWTVTSPLTMPGGVSCPIADGVLTCTGITLPATGGKFQAEATSETPGDGSLCGPIRNTATLTGGGTGEDSATTSVDCREPAALSVTKTASAFSVASGEQIAFDITVANTGDEDATNLSLLDALPMDDGLDWSIESGFTFDTCVIDASGQPKLDCDAATLAGGTNMTVRLTSPTTEATCGTVTNENADASATDLASISSDSASVEVVCDTPGPAGEVTISKTADAAEVEARQPIGYTITVRNDGHVLADDVTFTDQLPAGSGFAWTDDQDACAIVTVQTCG